MKERIKALYEKYKDLIPYVIFGVLTTLVNYVSYWLFAHPLGCGTVFSTAAAWILSVLFAYVTNRRWVFHSEARGAKAIGQEFAAFVAARLGTGMLDMLFMYVFVDVVGWNDMVIKLASNVVVVILNYILSKFVIFKKKAE